MFDVGNRIHELRKSKNIKSVVLAQACGFSQGFLSTIENNNKKCSLENLEKICNALEISLTEFFSPTEPKLTDIEYRFMSLLKGFDHEQLLALIAFLEKLHLEDKNNHDN